MKYKVERITSNEVDFGAMDNRYFLVGLLNEFMNRFQTVGDRHFNGISWKQCFLLNCISYFTTSPTLKELSELVGSSHQNVKQMLLKLERGGYVKLIPDEKDKRKQRILITELTAKLRQESAQLSDDMMGQLFDGVDSESIAMAVQTIQQLDSNLHKMK